MSSEFFRHDVSDIVLRATSEKNMLAYIVFFIIQGAKVGIKNEKSRLLCKKKIVFCFLYRNNAIFGSYWELRGVKGS